LLALALARGGQAGAAAEDRPARHPEVKQAKTVEAPHPALFRIVNGKSTVYLLGSIHVLPVKFSWRSPAIDQVIGAADVFMFEANLDFATAEFHYFLDQHGYLPRGQTLHQMLSPVALQQYVALIRDLHIDPNRLDYFRPGVAVLLLEETVLGSRGALGPGVDAMLVRYAKAHAKEVDYLETLESHFELLTTLGGGDKVTILEKSLASRENSNEKYRATLSAWAKGDLAQLNALDDEEPNQRVLLLDNRNRAWLPRIEAMLNVPKTSLVTVGALHLAGSNNVIDLLCTRGWKVQRIQTGAAPPPPACRI
jgi:hypothetical protein